MATNANVLAPTLPQLQQAEQTLSNLAAAQGITYRIAPFGGFRTQSDTSKILQYRTDDYAVYVANLQATNPDATPQPIESWRRIAPYGQSYHDYGAAFDIQIITPAPGKSNSDSLKMVGALAGKAGLRWGYSFGDAPHFELAVPLQTAKDMWNDFQGGTSAGYGTVTAVGALAVLGMLWLVVRRWL